MNLNRGFEKNRDRASCNLFVQYKGMSLIFFYVKKHDEINN